MTDRRNTPENTASKSKLLAAARQLGSAAKQVEKLDDSSHNWIDWIARKRAPGSGRLSGGMAPPVFPDFERFITLHGELVWAQQLLEEAAALVPRQQSRWRERASRNRLIGFARELAPTYEELTGRRATVDNWPESKTRGPWPEFYSRVAKLALNLNKIPDLRGMLVEASQPPVSIRS
ncbi:MAG: hypothetical protein ACR2JJ_04630 [Sphingomicrobium sp.]